MAVVEADLLAHELALDRHTLPDLGSGKAGDVHEFEYRIAPDRYPDAASVDGGVCFDDGATKGAIVDAHGVASPSVDKPQGAIADQGHAVGDAEVAPVLAPCENRSAWAGLFEGDSNGGGIDADLCGETMATWVFVAVVEGGRCRYDPGHGLAPRHERSAKAVGIEVQAKGLQPAGIPAFGYRVHGSFTVIVQAVADLERVGMDGGVGVVAVSADLGGTARSEALSKAILVRISVASFDLLHTRVGVIAVSRDSNPPRGTRTARGGWLCRAKAVCIGVWEPLCLHGPESAGVGIIAIDLIGCHGVFNECDGGFYALNECLASVESISVVVDEEASCRAHRGVLSMAVDLGAESVSVGIGANPAGSEK